MVSSSVHYTDSKGAGPSVGIGYGGLIVELEALDWSAGSLSASVLVGGGNADVSDPLVGAELGSDNFLVLHPVFRFRRPLRAPLDIGLEAGYRFAMGVEDLPGLNRRDLSGPTLSVSMHAIRR